MSWSVSQSASQTVSQTVRHSFSYTVSQSSPTQLNPINQLIHILIHFFTTPLLLHAPTCYLSDTAKRSWTSQHDALSVSQTPASLSSLLLYRVLQVLGFR